jgi:hypothetical protein
MHTQTMTQVTKERLLAGAIALFDIALIVGHALIF